MFAINRTVIFRVALHRQEPLFIHLVLATPMLAADD